MLVNRPDLAPEIEMLVQPKIKADAEPPRPVEAFSEGRTAIYKSGAKGLGGQIPSEQ